MSIKALTWIFALIPLAAQNRFKNHFHFIAFSQKSQPKNRGKESGWNSVARMSLFINGWFSAKHEGNEWRVKISLRIEFVIQQWKWGAIKSSERRCWKVQSSIRFGCMVKVFCHWRQDTITVFVTFCRSTIQMMCVSISACLYLTSVAPLRFHNGSTVNTQCVARRNNKRHERIQSDMKIVSESI